MVEQTAAPPGMPKEAATPTELPTKAPEAPAKKPGLFAPRPKKPEVDIHKAVSDLAGELNNIGRRLMVLEERYTNIRKKTQVTDQNMLNNNKRIMTELQTTHIEMDELRKQITDIIDKMKIIVRELKECAKHQEVAVLQKYISIWEPVNFITRESAAKMIKDQVEAQFKDLNIRLQQEDYIKEQIRLILKDMKLE